MSKPIPLTEEQIRIFQEIGAGGDAAFVREIRRFSHIGYGRMLQLVSREWYRAASERGDPTSGVLVDGTCLGLLSPKKQREYIAGYETDPQFRKR